MKMHFVKVLCNDRNQLLDLDLGINTYECGPGELKAVHYSLNALKQKLSKANITIIGEYQEL